jgi:hypothetical protein
MDLISIYLYVKVKNLPMQALFRECEILKSYSLSNETGKRTMNLTTS